MATEVVESIAMGAPPAETKPIVTVEADTSTAKRLERANEHLLESLKKADPLEANLGAVSSDLMGMACRLNDAIVESFGKGSLDHFEKLVPAIDAYLRVARQIDRLASLDRRLASSHAAACR
jgi:hypothetical protein